jgi:hypothetical protein
MNRAVFVLRTRTALRVVGIGISLSGCGADDDIRASPWGDMPLSPAPIAGCEDEAYEYCDIRKAKCQRQVYSLVACLRALSDGEAPPVRVISEDEYRAEQAANWEETEVSTFNHFENALALLGLVDAGAYSEETQIDHNATNVDAYYSNETMAVTVIDHGTPFDDFDAVPLLAHEFVHAQQDQELNLKAFREAYASTGDQSLAVLSLIEGEATLYATLVAAALGGVHLRRIDLGATFDARAERRMEWLFEQPSPYSVRRSAFPYGAGALYAYLGWREFNPEGLRAQFADPPLSSQRLMASRDALAEEVGKPVQTAAPTSEAIGPFVTDDVLGALGVRLFLRGEASEDSDELALAWRGDHVWGYATETGNGVIWTVAFASAAAASNFAELAARMLAERDVFASQRVDGQTATVMVATDAVLLGELVSATD